MFRFDATRSAKRIFLVMAMAFSLALTMPFAADAAKIKRFSGNKHNSGSVRIPSSGVLHGGGDLNFGSKRTKSYRQGVRRDYNARSYSRRDGDYARGRSKIGDYGYRYGNSPRRIYRNSYAGYPAKQRRGYYNRSSGALVIVVNEALAGDKSPAAISSGAYLEEACDPGEYCVLRLGPYANSPKIIKLNTSAKRIDGTDF